MIHDIEKFKEIRWEDVRPNQPVYIAGKVVNGEPTEVYGPHKLIDCRKKLLQSGGTGRFFSEHWHCLYVPKGE